MSASQWRRAMNSAATAASPASLPRVTRSPETGATSRISATTGPAPLWSERIGIRPRHLIVLAAVVLYPFIASPFFSYQIGAQSLALGGYFLVKHLVRAPFGIALQGIRDNPRRMDSLGYHVTAHRVAAYAVSGLLAAVGGVLMVWYNGRISPGTINLAQMIAILIVAVLGGMRHPIGAFIGAIVYVLLQNFAIDLFVRERFNLVIGGVFLAIVLFSPDGLLGLWAKLRSSLVRTQISHRKRRPQ